MSDASLVVVFGAGLVGGAMNALAGGGSFVTLPTMIGAGLSSVAANASSTVALYPGGAASAYAYREALGPVAGTRLGPLVAATVAGGALGALLLVLTPPTTFDRVLPWLLLVALLTLAFGRRVGAALAGSLRLPSAVICAIQFVLGIYGGYFGGAVGIMMMAIWSLVDLREIKELNATRTLMVMAANSAAVLIFIGAGQVAWRETLAMLIGATLGGYLGALLGRRLPAAWVRVGTLLMTGAITILFFWKSFGAANPVRF